ncbi:MAG: ribosome silencing factor [Polynucleobacter sp.]|jgi:ribosome-associated protein|nr:ribosome silencing factor [Polynucleobacter sp.]NDH68872.1 ribosome silencing factor [Gammaproteobacteria bacterium]
MDLRKLQRVIIDALEDVKAQDIRVYDTAKLSELFDRIIIVTGSSNRQTRSLALAVKEEVQAHGGEIISIEGLETGEWVLVDCGDIVVHILQPMLRAYYQLEGIWGDKPVRVKLASNKKLVKASEDMADDE